MFAIVYVNTWDSNADESFVFADTLQGAFTLANVLVEVDKSVRVVRIEDRKYMTDKSCHYQLDLM